MRWPAWPQSSTLLFLHCLPCLVGAGRVLRRFAPQTSPSCRGRRLPCRPLIGVFTHQILTPLAPCQLGTPLSPSPSACMVRERRTRCVSAGRFPLAHLGIARADRPLRDSLLTILLPPTADPQTIYPCRNLAWSRFLVPPTPFASTTPPPSRRPMSRCSTSVTQGTAPSSPCPCSTQKRARSPTTLPAALCDHGTPSTTTPPRDAASVQGEDRGRRPRG